MTQDQEPPTEESKPEVDLSAMPSTEDFAQMFEASFTSSNLDEGGVAKGKVVEIENDMVVVDVGLKTEGRIPMKEFTIGNDEGEPAIGDEVEVYIERIENALGDAVLSREKARREEAWEKLERQYADAKQVKGQINGRVKGGFTVDLGGASAFLPGSQVDIRPVRDVSPLMNIDQPFAILKMDRLRGNIVVSRRAILEEERAGLRAEIVSQLVEGEKRKGVVKNITDYGAFVDLGGIDGLLHVTDMSWRRVTHPSQIINVGDEIDIQIIRINPESQRISLGMKQLQDDPWVGIDMKYPVGAKLEGKVTNVTDYGAFVEIDEGVEGLIHVSEMSWTSKNVNPSQIVNVGDEVEVLVLEVDQEKRRVSLGLKQCVANPWESFVSTYPEGSEVEGEIRTITEFGLFVGLTNELDGMVHMSDLSWDQSGDEAIKEYESGQQVKVKILEVDSEKERISLGIKQLSGDPLGEDEVRKGGVITCVVSEVSDKGLEVTYGPENKFSTFIRKSDLSRDRAEQRPDRFAVGDKLDAMVTSLNKADRKITLSIKALEIKEEKEAVEQYGSADAGASLGDILGAALRDQDDKEEKNPS